MLRVFGSVWWWFEEKRQSRREKKKRKEADPSRHGTLEPERKIKTSPRLCPLELSDWILSLYTMQSRAHSPPRKSSAKNERSRDHRDRRDRPERKALIWNVVQSSSAASATFLKRRLPYRYLDDLLERAEACESERTRVPFESQE